MFRIPQPPNNLKNKAREYPMSAHRKTSMSCICCRIMDGFFLILRSNLVHQRACFNWWQFYSKIRKKCALYWTLMNWLDMLMHTQTMLTFVHKNWESGEKNDPVFQSLISKRFTYKCMWTDPCSNTKLIVEGRGYCLTRMGFGLKVAPLWMLYNQKMRLSSEQHWRTLIISTSMRI